jgi:hypothetical protein
MIAIVLLVVCLGVSLGFDVFLYVQTLDLRGEVEGLTWQVDSLNAQISDMVSTKNFTFELPGDDGGLVKMMLTFKIVGENLSISAEVNDKQGELIVVFDRDSNGTIMGDDGWMFYGVPAYRDVFHVNSTSGMFFIAKMPPHPSPYHHAITTANATYFDIRLPLSMLNLQDSLVYVSELSVSGRGAIFDFGLEV